MSKPSDLETLASRFLELWQDQLAAMALDPDNVEAMTRFYRLFTDTAFTAVAGAGDATQQHKDGKNAPARPASRSKAASASSDGTHVRLDELARRLAALEKRLDAMESKPRPRRRSPSKKSRQR
ncbi:MAG: hypothetical protein J4G10_05315 [Alphaproteobacteria bacterium]|nr:hypothetical protein [Alphaproteobacteria bacterium]